MKTQDGFITKLIGEIIIVLAALWLCAAGLWAQEPALERPVLRPVEVVPVEIMPVEIIRPAEPRPQPQERPDPQPERHQPPHHPRPEHRPPEGPHHEPRPQPERPHEPIDPEYGRDWPDPRHEPEHEGDHHERPEHEPDEHDRPWEHEPGHEPEHEPGYEPGHEPEHEPEREPEHRPEWEIHERPEHPEMPEDLDLQPAPEIPQPKEPWAFADTLKPDLLCTLPDSAGGVVTGGGTSLKVTVWNLGKVATTKPFRVDIQLVGGAAGSNVGHTWVSKSLTPGQSITANVHMTQSTATDPQYRVMVDASEVIDESDETNNHAGPFKYIALHVIQPKKINAVGILKFKVHNKYLCPGQRPTITAEVSGKDIAWLIVYLHKTPAAGPHHVGRRFADMGLEGFAERTWMPPVPVWPENHQPQPGDTMRVGIGIKDKKTFKVLAEKYIDVPIARAPQTLSIGKVTYTWNKAQQRVTDVQVHLKAGGTQPFNIGDFGAADAGSISVLCTIKRRRLTKHPKFGHDYVASDIVHNKLYDVNGKGAVALKYPGGPGLATHTPTYGPVTFPVSAKIDSPDKVTGAVKHIHYGSPDSSPDAVYTYPAYVLVFVRARTATGSVMLKGWAEIKEAPTTIFNESVTYGTIINSGGDGPYEN